MQGVRIVIVLNVPVIFLAVAPSGFDNSVQFTVNLDAQCIEIQTQTPFPFGVSMRRDGQLLRIFVCFFRKVCGYVLNTRHVFLGISNLGIGYILSKKIYPYCFSGLTAVNT